MRTHRVKTLLAASLLALSPALQACDSAALESTGGSGATRSASDLPSWNEGPSRSAITEFVERVTDPAHPDFIPAVERIATFDNDGTLWGESPIYFQLQFALDRLAALAPEHPEWQDDPALSAAMAGDLRSVAAQGLPAVLKVVTTTHAGMSQAEFTAAVEDWFATAREPRFERPYSEMIYAPMVELLEYLRAHDFQVRIVSGGGQDFIRVVSEELYGIPPELVTGTTVALEADVSGEQPVLRRLAEIDHVNDGPGKIVGIHRAIGRRPVIAVGNSDGDLQMLQWSADGARPSLQILVRHTDANREWAYDRGSPVGGLDAAWDEAMERGWIVVDMAAEWSRVFPFQDGSGP